MKYKQNVWHWHLTCPVSLFDSELKRMHSSMAANICYIDAMRLQQVVPSVWWYCWLQRLTVCLSETSDLLFWHGWTRKQLMMDMVQIPSAVQGRRTCQSAASSDCRYCNAARSAGARFSWNVRETRETEWLYRRRQRTTAWHIRGLRLLQALIYSVELVRALTVVVATPLQLPASAVPLLFVGFGRIAVRSSSACARWFPIVEFYWWRRVADATGRSLHVILGTACTVQPWVERWAVVVQPTRRAAAVRPHLFITDDDPYIHIRPSAEFQSNLSARHTQTHTQWDWGAKLDSQAWKISALTVLVTDCFSFMFLV